MICKSRYFFRSKNVFLCFDIIYEIALYIKSLNNETCKYRLILTQSNIYINYEIKININNDNIRSDR